RIKRLVPGVILPPEFAIAGFPMLTPRPTPDDLALSRVLAALRRRIRWHVMLESLLYAVLFLGGVFWIGLAVDWLVEPPPAVRRIFNWGLGASVAAILGWWGLRRVFVPMSDGGMALLLERRHPELADR